MKTAVQLWKDTCQVLQKTVSADLYSRWFTAIHPLELTCDVLMLGVDNEFHLIWLQDNFSSLVRDAVQHVAQRPVGVKFSIASVPLATEAPSLPAATPPLSSSRTAATIKLNPRYVFDSFVIGPNNNFAHAAALAVAQSPSKAYNPLFIYGGVGLGKTHLMQAIGHFVAVHKRTAHVCYISCEQFTNEFITAIQNSTLTKFRKKYRQMDVLLIDDIQFLAGKERVQEEFFHTFNSLSDSHKQLVFSSDRPAAEIANLEARLVSRLEWGLVTDLQPPALETRIAILRKKAVTMEVKLSDPVLNFIAERIRTNIRRLEGALVRVASFAALTGKEIKADMLEGLLRDSLHEESKRAVSIDAIQKKVAEHFDLRLADMTSRRRPQNVAFPRQIAMFLCRTLTERSLVDIGESFGGRDHGTVMHACRLIQTKMGADEQFRQTVSYLETALQR